jgi:hypothetical protein
MKNFLATLLATCALFSAHSQSRLQVIDSVKVIPVGITSIDSVKVIAYTHASYSPCRINEFVAIFEANTIIINAKFLVGIGAAHCYRTDTITLAPRAPGSYELIFTLTSATYGTFLDADTIQFIVQQAVGIGDTPGKGLFHIYPNPTNNRLMLCQNQPTRETFAIAIFNATGNLVLAEETNVSLTELDISHLPKGIYFIQITGKQGKKMGASFVKSGF